MDARLLRLAHLPFHSAVVINVKLFEWESKFGCGAVKYAIVSKRKRCAANMKGRPLAVVTASASGIGLAVAHALARKGYHVIVSSRDQQHVDDAVAELIDRHGPDSASGLVCHVAIPEHRAALVAHAMAHESPVRALVLNAAISTSYGPCLATTEAQWDKMFEVNVKSAFMLVKAFASTLSSDASIVFVTSLAAYTPIPNLGAYSVTKTAVLGLVKVLAQELGRKGVRVNAVAPGLIETRFSEKLWKSEDTPMNAAATKPPSKLLRIPLRRNGLPEDVAGAVLFLVGKESSYITGETICISGGLPSKL